MVTMSKDKVTCIAGDMLEGCAACGLSFLMDWGYMFPHIYSFEQSVFREGLTGEANLPAVMYIHDNASCLPRHDIFENLFYPLRFSLVTYYSSIINVAGDYKNPWDLIQHNKDWIHGQAKEIDRGGSPHVDA